MDEVLVAVVSTVGVVGAAAIGALGEAIRRNARATRQAVGNPEPGDGTVVHMLERVLDSQAGQDRRIARLEERQNDHRRTIHDHGRQLHEHGRRLVALEPTG
jgi:hypothetical protein